MAGRDNRPIEVWEAALGRHVVLIEARTWFEARDVARTMLGGEPEYVRAPAKYLPPHEIRLFDKPTEWHDQIPDEFSAIRFPSGICRERWEPAPLL